MYETLLSVMVSLLHVRSAVTPDAVIRNELQKSVKCWSLPNTCSQRLWSCSPGDDTCTSCAELQMKKANALIKNFFKALVFLKFCARWACVIFWGTRSKRLQVGLSHLWRLMLFCSSLLLIITHSLNPLFEFGTYHRLHGKIASWFWDYFGSNLILGFQIEW